MAWSDIQTHDSMITFTQVSDDHLRDLANNLDKTDLLEILGSTGMNAFDSLKEAVSISSTVYTVLDDSSVIGVFGVAEHEDGIGFPWGFFTQNLRNIPMFVLRQSLKHIKEFQSRLPILRVYVLWTNTRSRTYLEWLGFKPTKKLIDGLHDTVFMEYERCATQL